MESKDKMEIGAVLITGGAGFVGSHIAQYFLQESKGTFNISIMSRNPHQSLLAGVSYHAGDISNIADLHRILEATRPAVIIHAACPSAVNASKKVYQEVIVNGTKALLEVALKKPSVKAFIYTSSATLAAGAAHINLDETAPLADLDRWSHPYAKCKAIADKMVLSANMPYLGDEKEGLLTACIRLPIVYGERDLVSITGCLGALERNQTNVMLGDGENLWDFVSAENAAHAHYLLAMALMRRAGDSSASKVDGEAFNITDGQRQKFWDYPRLAWEAAGWEQPANEKPMKLPSSLLLAIAFCMEWGYWIFTFGQQRPTVLGTQQVEYSCFEHTYQLEKARQMLDYSPAADFKGGVRRAVHWSMENDGWRARLAKCKTITKKIE